MVNHHLFSQLEEEHLRYLPVSSALIHLILHMTVIGRCVRNCARLVDIVCTLACTEHLSFAAMRRRSINFKNERRRDERSDEVCHVGTLGIYTLCI